VAAAPTVGPDGPLGQSAAPDTCACRMRVVGYVLGPRRGGLDCDSPLQVVCRLGCGRADQWACAGHRESRCRPCAARYRRRVRAVAASGTNRLEGYLYLLTLTAPGEREHYLPNGDTCPCTPPGGVDLHVWNTGHSARWNRVRTRLRQLHPDLQFFRGVEVQKRGALHHHSMTWSPTPLSLAEVRRLAVAAGYGHSVDLAPCVPGSRKAAYYVSKYVTKACDSRAEVPWVDLVTGEVVEGRYRTWSMSREWGQTMAQVRAIGAEYARKQREAQPPAVELEDQAVRSDPESLARPPG
jgi:hypothetical protein